MQEPCLGAGVDMWYIAQLFTGETRAFGSICNGHWTNYRNSYALIHTLDLECKKLTLLRHKLLYVSRTS